MNTLLQSRKAMLIIIWWGGAILAGEAGQDSITISVDWATSSTARITITNNTDARIRLLRRWDSDFGVVSLKFTANDGRKVLKTEEHRLWSPMVSDVETLESKCSLSRIVRHEPIPVGDYEVVAEYSVAKESPFMETWNARMGEEAYEVDLMLNGLLKGTFSSSGKMCTVNEYSRKPKEGKPEAKVALRILNDDA